MSPEKPYNTTFTLPTTLLLAYSEKKMVDWRIIIGELVHKLAINTKRGHPSYIGLFFFHLLYTQKTYSQTKRNPMDRVSDHARAPIY